ncbi:hypothetical protein EV193_104282 [Herbihabitans rhizosphaerae]|uniref:Uncharacterized protein n=1 Tax=Herbihabitans rhizosphaerae TaxID=1872711 RepID=A0A4Q7KTD6_9PSEU|nr:hypothetical protein [Herbihabitans rhizosphaerae]RZS39071.1 hypothetical protein EV193_104282 [Herbihabitans rhizosphaerae]
MGADKSDKKMRGAFGAARSVLAASNAVAGIKKAKQDNDKLVLANAVASVAVAITGALIAVRTLRKGGDHK